MAVRSYEIELSTRGNNSMYDVTEQVNQHIKASGMQNGIATVFCPSATSALTTIEYEEGALADFERLFEEIVDANRPYQHNERWRDGNGHSHIRAALLGPSITVPFVNTYLTLGTWQAILYIDFDVRPRHRTLIVQVIGE